MKTAQPPTLTSLYVDTDPVWDREKHEYTAQIRARCDGHLVGEVTHKFRTQALNLAYEWAQSFERGEAAVVVNRDDATGATGNARHKAAIEAHHNLLHADPVESGFDDVEVRA